MDPQREVAIAGALDFSDLDLRLNRAGGLSERQRETLAATRSRGVAGTVVLASVVLAFVVFILVVVLPRLTNSQATGSGSVPIRAIVLGGLGVVVLGIGVALFLSRGSLDRPMSGPIQQTLDS